MTMEFSATMAVNSMVFTGLCFPGRTNIHTLGKHNHGKQCQNGRGIPGCAFHGRKLAFFPARVELAQPRNLQPWTSMTNSMRVLQLLETNLSRAVIKCHTGESRMKM